MAEDTALALAHDKELSQIFLKSRFFANTESEAQAIVKIMAGREIGLGPFESMANFHIVKGKLVMAANLMAAGVKKSGKYNYRVKTHTNKECAIEFFEGSESLGLSVFTIEDAKAAGLVRSDSVWVKYPRNMLYARAMSNGMKWYCPDAFGHTAVYVPEEMGVEVNDEGEPINITASVSMEVPVNETTMAEPDTIEAAVEEPKPKKYKKNRLKKDDTIPVIHKGEYISPSMNKDTPAVPANTINADTIKEPFKEATFIYKGEVIKALNIPKTLEKKRAFLMGIANMKKHELNEQLMDMLAKLEIANLEAMEDDDVGLLWTMLIENNADVELKLVK